MSTTSPQSDLHQALQSWHAALARNELEAQIAARLPFEDAIAATIHEDRIVNPEGDNNKTC